MIRPVSKGIDKALTIQPKLYFSDSGILNKLQKGLSSGHVFENAIANQLSLLGEVTYFEKSKSWEIDFILNGNVAYEVKETPTLQHLNTLKMNAKSIGIEDVNLIGRHPGGSGFKSFLWGGNIF